MPKVEHVKQLFMERIEFIKAKFHKKVFVSDGYKHN